MKLFNAIKENTFFTCSIGAFFLILLLNLILGSYFNDYEIFFNQIFLTSFSTEPTIFYSDLHFGFIWIYGILGRLLHETSIYSWVFTFLNYLLLTTALIIILTLTKVYTLSLRKTILLLFTGVLLILSTLLFIDNVKTSFFLCFQAFMLLLLIQKKFLSKRYYLLFTILVFLAILLRHEMGMLFWTLSVLYFIIFYSRSELLVSSLILLFSLSISSIYHLNFKKDNLKMSIMLRYEREVSDKNEELDFDQISLREKAMKFFIIDEGIISIDDYEAALGNKTMIYSILEKRAFLAVYLANLKEGLPYFKKYGFASLIILFLSLFFLRKQKKLTHKHRWLMFILIYLVYPFILCSILLVPYRFWEVYYCVMLSFLLFKIYELELSNLKIFFFTAILFGVFSYNLSDDYIKHITINKKGVDNFTCIEKIKKDNSTDVFIAQAFHLFIYPNKLFNPYNRNKINHYYLDAFYFYNYQPIRDYHAEYFNNLQGSLPKKLEKCAKEKVIIYGFDWYLQFLKDYMQEYHKSSITFVKVDNVCEIGKYGAYTIHFNR